PARAAARSTGEPSARQVSVSPASGPFPDSVPGPGAVSGPDVVGGPDVTDGPGAVAAPGVMAGPGAVAGLGQGARPAAARSSAEMLARGGVDPVVVVVSAPSRGHSATVAARTRITAASTQRTAGRRQGDGSTGSLTAGPDPAD